MCVPSITLREELQRKLNRKNTNHKLITKPKRKSVCYLEHSNPAEMLGRMISSETMWKFGNFLNKWHA